MKKIISKEKLANEYPFKATVFCSRNEITDAIILKDADIISIYLAKAKIGLVNGASKDGLMGHMSKKVFKSGGDVFGIGLHKYEPLPHQYLTNWEGYDNHWERQRRLIELGDIYVALPGGLGTLHEIIDIHLMQFLDEIKHPIILVGDYMKNYQLVLDFFTKNNLLHKLPSNVIFAKNGNEAIEHIEKYILSLKKSNYFSSIYYPAITPEAIFNHIKQNQNPYHVLFNNIKMRVLPNVYPSNRFRSSIILGKVVAKMSKGKKVADIACGHGTMGLVAVMNGAKHVVQVDINPAAVENARQNAKLLEVDNKLDIYEGDVFEPLSYRYQQYFDIIFFNPPFHRDAKHKNDKLMYAFYTQGNEGGVLDKFLIRAKYYLAPGGKIILGFSNKDAESLAFLEEALKRYGYDFSISLIANQETAADNRIYTITVKKETLKLNKIKNDEKVRIGAVMAQTGVAKNDGQLMLNGINLAIKELRQQGITIELGLADDQSSEKGAVKGIVNMLDEFKPNAIVGPTWSYLIDASIPVLEESGVTYFTPATSSEIIDSKTKNRLSGSYNDSKKEDLIADWFKGQFSKKIAYIHRDNKWGRFHAEMIKRISEDLNVSVSFFVVQNKYVEAEFADILKTIKKQDIEAIVIDNYDDIFYQFSNLQKKNKIHAPVLCTISLSQSLVKEIKNLNPENAIYFIDAKIPEIFTEKYYHEYPTASLNRYAFNAYAGVHLLTQAVLNANGKSTKDFIIEDMKAIVSGEVFSYSKDGDLRGSGWYIDRVIL